MEAKKFAFTKTRIAALKAPPQGKRVYYYDTKTPHLAVCVTGTGAKSFYLYRKIQGRPERINLGRFPTMTVEQARNAAEKHNGRVAEGENPAESKRQARRVQTLEELYQKYRAQHLVPEGKQTKNPDSYWKLYLSPWGRKKLSAITHRDVKNLHSTIAVDKGNVTANRTYQLLRAMYNMAAYWEDYTGENPASRIKRKTEHARKRFLHPDEMPAFFKALADEPNDTFRDFVLTALFTGARRGNVQAMRWEDVHLERATWEIPETKSGEPHTLPLSPEAVAVLRTRKARSRAGEWVFPSYGVSGHLMEPKRAWGALLKRAGIKDLRMHDLRRTLGSWQAATGSSLPIIGAMLGHRNVATTAIYARLNLDPVRESVNTATKAIVEAGGLLEGTVED